jgi:hypothetical protein
MWNAGDKSEAVEYLTKTTSVLKLGQTIEKFIAQAEVMIYQITLKKNRTLGPRDRKYAK